MHGVISYRGEELARMQVDSALACQYIQDWTIPDGEWFRELIKKLFLTQLFIRAKEWEPPARHLIFSRFHPREKTEIMEELHIEITV